MDEEKERKKLPGDTSEGEKAFRIPLPADDLQPLEGVEEKMNIQDDIKDLDKVIELAESVQSKIKKLESARDIGFLKIIVFYLLISGVAGGFYFLEINGFFETKIYYTSSLIIGAIILIICLIYLGRTAKEMSIYRKEIIGEKRILKQLHDLIDGVMASVEGSLNTFDTAYYQMRLSRLKF